MVKYCAANVHCGLVYIYYILWIHSVCTLSACTHFDTLQQTIVSVKCKCTIAQKLKEKKRSETKRMQEWMNEWMNGKRDAQKEAAVSSTNINHVIPWKPCVTHTKYYKMRNWKCWKLENSRSSSSALEKPKWLECWTFCGLRARYHKHTNTAAHTTINQMLECIFM